MTICRRNPSAVEKLQPVQKTDDIVHLLSTRVYSARHLVFNISKLTFPPWSKVLSATIRQADIAQELLIQRAIYHNIDKTIPRFKCLDSGGPSTIT